MDEPRVAMSAVIGILRAVLLRLIFFCAHRSNTFIFRMCTKDNPGLSPPQFVSGVPFCYRNCSNDPNEGISAKALEGRTEPRESLTSNVTCSHDILVKLQSESLVMRGA